VTLATSDVVPEKRPTWRRLASFARDRLYRGLSLADDALRRGDDALLPPAHLRIYYYRSLNPAAFERACHDVRLELVSRGLQPHHRLLDIGCGIGNLAIGLLDYLDGAYQGVDVHPEAIAWCQKAITPRHPRFRFQRIDVLNHAYNPSGPVTAATFRFPFADEEFDYVFLGSVFTHMLPGDVERYIGEIARMLRPAGVCIASFFLLNDSTRPGVDAGRSFIPFGVSHPSGVCRLHSASAPEAAVCFEERFVQSLLGRAGLQITDVRRGGWWNGQSHDQDVVTIGHR
jgi:SAM-dependent methyltransferase